MPLATITCPGGSIPDQALWALAKKLPEVLAATLSCSDRGGTLEAEEVEVRIQRPELIDVVNGELLTIDVLAPLFEDRQKNLTDRTIETTQQIFSFLSNDGRYKGVTFGVWICLVPSCYRSGTIV